MTMRSGRVRYLRAAAVFVVALVVFDRLFFAALQQTYLAVDRQSKIQQKLSALKDKPSYQCLILGTSRTFEAIHPAGVALALGVKAYKEAAKGKGLHYNHEFYGVYERLVGRPRLVIYGLDYFMFGMESEAPLMQRFGGSGHSAPRAAVLWPPLLMLANKPDNEKAIVRILERLQSRALSAAGDFDPENHVEDMERYTGNPVSMVVDRPQPARFNTVGYARYPGLEGEYFARLVQKWNDDGVVVVFVYPPDYIATYRTNVELDQFIAQVRHLVSRCATCVVLDYSDPVRFPIAAPAYFRDGDYGNSNSHLSKLGVERLNRQFLPDLKTIAARFGVVPTRK